MTHNKEFTMLTRAFLLAVIVAGGCLGQNEPAKATGGPPAEPKYFHLDFVVKELEGGKVINARAYTMTVATDTGRSSVRSGNKVPVPTEQHRAAGAPGNTQFTYVDVGTNIDCWNSKEIQGQLVLTVTAEVSSAAEAPDVTAPVIRQVKWNAPVIVPLRKATVIFASDDPSSKRQMQLELTATPIK
jgi:hypothetical protein